MEEKNVNNIIASLSRIDKSAEDIKKDTEQKKNQYAREIEEKIKTFDENLEKEHKNNMEMLAEKLENEKKEAMLKMRADMAVDVGKLDAAYDMRHESMAKEIFNDMINS